MPCPPLKPAPAGWWDVIKPDFENAEKIHCNYFTSKFYIANVQKKMYFSKEIFINGILNLQIRNS